MIKQVRLLVLPVVIRLKQPKVYRETPTTASRF